GRAAGRLAGIVVQPFHAPTHRVVVEDRTRGSPHVPAAAITLLLLLVYTYAGYPVVIGLLARAPRRRSEPLPAPDVAPFVSICLPVFNGGAYLRPKIDSLLAQDYPADRFEILIYCDGCTDDTEATARAIAETPEVAGRLRVVADAGRYGKPRGVNTLVPHARRALAP